MKKLKVTGFVYLKSSPYGDAEGSPNIRSCLHDNVINSEPIIRQKLTKIIVQTV